MREEPFHVGVRKWPRARQQAVIESCVQRIHHHRVLVWPSSINRGLCNPCLRRNGFDSYGAKANPENALERGVEYTPLDLGSSKPRLGVSLCLFRHWSIPQDAVLTRLTRSTCTFTRYDTYCSFNS